MSFVCPCIYIDISEAFGDDDASFMLVLDSKSTHIHSINIAHGKRLMTMKRVP